MTSLHLKFHKPQICSLFCVYRTFLLQFQKQNVGSNCWQIIFIINVYFNFFSSRRRNKNVEWFYKRKCTDIFNYICLLEAVELEEFLNYFPIVVSNEFQCLLVLWFIRNWVKWFFFKFIFPQKLIYTCSVCIFSKKKIQIKNVLFCRSSKHAITFNIMYLICVANINLFYYFL